ncbi:MAG: hypothetical protein WD894_11590 [Pirellulales bacterium]
MHCDRVYAILTRGPFPSGEVTDVAVEIHLAHCAECRRLAEALRPLERQPHEAIPEASHLPGYRGDHPEWQPHASEDAQQAAFASWRVPARRAPRRLVPFGLGRFVATVLFGVAIGVVLSTITAAGSSAQRTAMAAASFGPQKDDEWTEARLQAHLIYGLNLPRACSKLDAALFIPLSSDERSPAPLTAEPPSFVNQCCTQCHVAGGRTQVGPAQRRKLILSCTICHSDAERERW